MGLYYDIESLPTFHKAVITIGTFDGVHSGHKEILNEVVRHAAEAQAESIVITFEPHPRKLLHPEEPLKLLTPLTEKLNLIRETGIKHIVVAPFTKAFSELSAKQYIEDFLVKYFQPEQIIIGYDHHFGHDRTGDIGLLKEYEQEYHYKVQEIPAHLVKQAAVSSTKIRTALQEGNVREVVPMTGRHYSMHGTVTEGKKIGRTIGYPTANIVPDDPEQLVPANGVYAVRIKWKDTSYDAMLNIGFRPTVSNEQVLSIEAHLFNFDQQLYGDEVEVIFIERLRDEQKFNSVDALKEQLGKDQAAAMAILSGDGPV
jgi:riboflavin kinase/FMN adenylyltransferase